MVSVITAIFIFVIGQVIVRIIIDPINEQRKVVGRIAYVLGRFPTTHEQRMTERGPLQQPEEAELEKLAGELVMTLRTIPLYAACRWLRITLPKVSVEEAALQLLIWRTCVSPVKQKNNDMFMMAAEATERLRTLLKVENWMAGFNQTELARAAGLVVTPVAGSLDAPSENQP